MSSSAPGRSRKWHSNDAVHKDISRIVNSIRDIFAGRCNEVVQLASKGEYDIPAEVLDMAQRGKQIFDGTIESLTIEEAKEFKRRIPEILRSNFKDNLKKIQVVEAAAPTNAAAAGATIEISSSDDDEKENDSGKGDSPAVDVGVKVEDKDERVSQLNVSPHVYAQLNQFTGASLTYQNQMSAMIPEPWRMPVQLPNPAYIIAHNPNLVVERTQPYQMLPQPAHYPTFNANFPNQSVDDGVSCENSPMPVFAQNWQRLPNETQPTTAQHVQWNQQALNNMQREQMQVASGLSYSSSSSRGQNNHHRQPTVEQYRPPAEPKIIEASYRGRDLTSSSRDRSSDNRHRSVNHHNMRPYPQSNLHVDRNRDPRESRQQRDERTHHPSTNRPHAGHRSDLREVEHVKNSARIPPTSNRIDRDGHSSDRSEADHSQISIRAPPASSRIDRDGHRSDRREVERSQISIRTPPTSNRIDQRVATETSRPQPPPQKPKQPTLIELPANLQPGYRARTSRNLPAITVELPPVPENVATLVTADPQPENPPPTAKALPPRRKSVYLDKEKGEIARDQPSIATYQAKTNKPVNPARHAAVLNENKKRKIFSIDDVKQAKAAKKPPVLPPKPIDDSAKDERLNSALEKVTTRLLEKRPPVTRTEQPAPSTSKTLTAAEQLQDEKKDSSNSPSSTKPADRGRPKGSKNKPKQQQSTAKSKTINDKSQHQPVKRIKIAKKTRRISSSSSSSYDEIDKLPLARQSKQEEIYEIMKLSERKECSARKAGGSGSSSRSNSIPPINVNEQPNLSIVDNDTEIDDVPFMPVLTLQIDIVDMPPNHLENVQPDEVEANMEQLFANDSSQEESVAVSLQSEIASSPPARQPDEMENGYYHDSDEDLLELEYEREVRAPDAPPPKKRGRGRPRKVPREEKTPSPVMMEPVKMKEELEDAADEDDEYHYL